VVMFCAISKRGKQYLFRGNNRLCFTLLDDINKGNCALNLYYLPRLCYRRVPFYLSGDVRYLLVVQVNMSRLIETLCYPDDCSYFLPTLYQQVGE